MRKLYTIFLVIFLLGSASIKAQSTDGTDFWLTFGRNYLSESNGTALDLQIRIVNRDLANNVTINSLNWGLKPHILWRLKK